MDEDDSSWWLHCDGISPSEYKSSHVSTESIQFIGSRRLNLHNLHAAKHCDIQMKTTHMVQVD